MGSSNCYIWVISMIRYIIFLRNFHLKIYVKPRRHGLLNKKYSIRDNALQVIGQGGLQKKFSALGCPPELESKDPLLKTQNSLGGGQENVKLD